MLATLVKPQSRFLRRYIQYFFFIYNSDEGYTKTHVCYPNTNYCLGLHKGSRLLRLSETEYNVIPSNNYQSYLTGIYQKPINVRYKGAFEEVCIDFEPLGLEMLTGTRISPNVFLENALSLAFPRLQSEIYSAAFSDADTHSRALRLEKLFLSNLPTRSKFEFIEFNRIDAAQVEDLGNAYNLSYRSIHRRYKDLLGIGPKEFLNIRRLRRSIDQIHTTKNLIQTAHSQGFSDQSHMTRSFKQYTGLSPKAFLNNSRMVDQTLCWSLK